MRVNQKITVKGAPTQVSIYPVLVTDLSIQMGSGAKGQGYIMNGIPLGIIPAAKGAFPGQLSVILEAATSPVAPGGQYNEKDKHGIDLSQIWVDGDSPGDVIIVSARIKNT